MDGLGVGAARNGGGVSGYNADMANAQEITFTVSAGLGEAEVSGPALSIVPKTGGNTVKGSVYVAGVSSGMVGTNYTDELKNAGPERARRAAQAVGFHRRPRRSDQKDRLWYFLNLRNQGSHSSVPSMFANKNAGDPTKWTYEADTTRQSRTAGSWSIASVRLTTQATPRNKFNVYWDEQKPCTGATATRRGRRLPATADGRRLHLRRQLRRPRPKRRPTRTAISACNSSRGSRR